MCFIETGTQTYANCVLEEREAMILGYCDPNCLEVPLPALQEFPHHQNGIDHGDMIAHQLRVIFRSLSWGRPKCGARPGNPGIGEDHQMTRSTSLGMGTT